MKHPIATSLALALVLLAPAAPSWAAAGWPEPVVAMEDMVRLTDIKLKVKRPFPKGDVVRPVTMRVHVDAQGLVQRTVLIESCGNAAFDEEALYVMRAQRFAPKLIDGVARDVTLVVPLHIPLSQTAGR